MSSSFTYTWYLPCVTTAVFDILDILVDICKHFLTLYYRIFLLTHPITNTSAPILESTYAKSQIHQKKGDEQCVIKRADGYIHIGDQLRHSSGMIVDLLVWKIRNVIKPVKEHSCIVSY